MSAQSVHFIRLDNPHSESDPSIHALEFEKRKIGNLSEELEQNLEQRSSCTPPKNASRTDKIKKSNMPHQSYRVDASEAV